jgi:5-methylcytosine-specific restriction protein A
MAWSRESRHKRGYGTAWDKLRKRILARDKHLCQQCRREGRITSGNQVDHIKPKAKGGTDDETNLETLCKAHHDEKTARENGARPRVQIGIDGWPVQV